MRASLYPRCNPRARRRRGCEREREWRTSGHRAPIQKLIAEKVLLESKLNDAPPTLAAVKAAAVQIFPSDDRVVVTMVREYTWGEVGRRVLLAAAVVAVAAVAVKRRAR